MKTISITINDIPLKITYSWNAFLRDVVITKIIVPIGESFNYNRVKQEVLKIELARTSEKWHIVQEEREEEARYPDDSDPMRDGVE